MESMSVCVVLTMLPMVGGNDYGVLRLVYIYFAVCDTKQ